MAYSGRLAIIAGGLGMCIAISLPACVDVYLFLPPRSSLAPIAAMFLHSNNPPTPPTPPTPPLLTSPASLPHTQQQPY